MKRIFVLINLTCSLYSAYCQNIGFRGNTVFSDNRKINNAIGFGGYLNINGFSEKIELLFSLDYNFNNKQFPDEGLATTYNRFYFSVNGLYGLSLAEKSKIKIGLGMNYATINASDGGIILQWINTYKSKYIGTELLTNVHFQEIFKLPINFDIFVTPTYLINIQNKNDSQNVESDYSENLKILNVQLGISYRIK